MREYLLTIILLLAFACKKKDTAKADQCTRLHKEYCDLAASLDTASASTVGSIRQAMTFKSTEIKNASCSPAVCK